MTKADHQAADRELVREVIARHLAQVFGPDNATRYEDEPFRIGVSFTDGVVIDVRIGYENPRREPAVHLVGERGFSRCGLVDNAGATEDRTAVTCRSCLKWALPNV